MNVAYFDYYQAKQNLHQIRQFRNKSITKAHMEKESQLTKSTERENTLNINDILNVSINNDDSSFNNILKSSEKVRNL